MRQKQKHKKEDLKFYYLQTVQYALINGQRQRAEPKLKAVCDHCGAVVHAKCGTKVVWHWAHLAAENCDSWYEPETKWHRDWKNHFGIHCSEVTLVKDGVRHIADVLTKNNLVIEFQNSPISSETIKARELFYDKMIWVINGVHFKESFKIWDKEFHDNWEIRPELVENTNLLRSQPQARILRVRGSQIKQQEIRPILTRLKFVHDRQQDCYTYDLKNLHNSLALEAKIQAGLLELYRAQKVEQKQKPVLYEWTRARKSWQEATRPVFIDFDQDYLVWIKTNMGSYRGEGVKVLKSVFLAKYA